MQELLHRIHMRELLHRSHIRLRLRATFSWSTTLKNRHLLGSSIFPSASQHLGPDGLILGVNSTYADGERIRADTELIHQLSERFLNHKMALSTITCLSCPDNALLTRNGKRGMTESGFQPIGVAFICFSIKPRQKMWNCTQRLPHLPLNFVKWRLLLKIFIYSKVFKVSKAHSVLINSWLEAKGNVYCILHRGIAAPASELR